MKRHTPIFKNVASTSQNKHTLNIE